MPPYDTFDKQKEKGLVKTCLLSSILNYGMIYRWPNKECQNRKPIVVLNAWELFFCRVPR